tara:strand:+ start:290 stop:925 length:636 start_codon:yes stop_codon:yes gene_type:complete
VQNRDIFVTITHNGQNMKYIVIDTETTGLDPQRHELLSLGAIVMIDGVITERIEIKIKPRNIDQADAEALRINGYSPYRWKHAIEGEHAVTIIKHLFLAHLDGILVGHNVNFDIKFLRAFADEFYQEFTFPVPYIDTRDVCRVNLAPYGCASMSLDNICLFLGWKRRKAHTALSDCEDCIKILRCMVPPSPKFIMYVKLRGVIASVKGLLS